jgi:ABC-type nickel/cobalt efflux system permease component RcnA
MTATRQNPFNLYSNKAGRFVRGLLAAIIVIAFLGLVFFLAAALTVAFFVVAGIALLAGGAYWLWRKVRGKKTSDGPEILVATHGPEGWTVDGSSRADR